MSENFFSRLDSHERQTFNSRTRIDQCGIQDVIDDCWGPRSTTRAQKHRLDSLPPDKQAVHGDALAALNEHRIKSRDQSHRHYDQPEVPSIHVRMPDASLSIPQTQPYFVFDSQSPKSRREQETEWLAQLRSQYVRERADGVTREQRSVTGNDSESRDTLQGVESRTFTIEPVSIQPTIGSERTITRDLAAGYAEPPVEAATKHKQMSHWNPQRGDLNIVEPASWQKLQDYAGDVGRANGWRSEHKRTFNQINTLRHALSAAYITYHYGADCAMLGGDWHELETSVREIGKGIPWKTDKESIHTWQDHGVDINNIRAGAKIAQDIRGKGGSWQDVECAIVDAVKHIDKDGKIPQPNVTLHSFLNQP